MLFLPISLLSTIWKFVDYYFCLLITKLLSLTLLLVYEIFRPRFLNSTVFFWNRREPTGIINCNGNLWYSDFAAWTCPETLSKILIRCVTWH